MTTFLTIVLVVCIALNLWLSAYTIKRESARRKKLQERINEYDAHIVEVTRENTRLQHLLAENTGLVGHLKKLIGKKDDEIARLSDKIAALPESPHTEPLEGDASRADKPLKPLNLVALDLQDLKQSYDELAKSYDFVSRQYENPSKRYIISNLVRLYEVKNLGFLAKALGVSTSSLSQKIKK